MVYLASAIENRPYPMGERLMLADIQMSYLFAVAEAYGILEGHKAPGAVEKAGPIMPKRI